MANSGWSRCRHCRVEIYNAGDEYRHSGTDSITCPVTYAEPISGEASPEVCVCGHGKNCHLDPRDQGNYHQCIICPNGTCDKYRWAGGASIGERPPESHVISIDTMREFLDEAMDLCQDDCSHLTSADRQRVSSGIIEQLKKSAGRAASGTGPQVCEWGCTSYFKNVMCPIHMKQLGGTERPCDWPFQGNCTQQDACLKANRCLKNLTGGTVSLCSEHKEPRSDCPTCNVVATGGTEESAGPRSTPVCHECKQPASFIRSQYVCKGCGRSFEGYLDELPSAAPSLTPRPTDDLVSFKRDPNSGAGLHAVFVGNMPVHHFNHAQPLKVQQYMNRIRDEIRQFFSAQEAGQ